MNDTVLVVQARQVSTMPRRTWEDQLARVLDHSQTRLGFMTPAHQRVRNFVVRELPRTGQPIPPDFISQSLELPLAQVDALLDELEQNLFFLVRNSQGAVAWAYPVTVEETPHELFFSTGERLYGA